MRCGSAFARNGVAKRLRLKTMKFSIVTPNYNYGRFLKKALESVLAQADAPGAPEIEHIVIDGGSTDNSVSILKDWAVFAAAQPAAKDGRYSFSYVSEPDQGQKDAINKGLRRATGDVVAWLNADEWYLPGKLALVAAAFAKHPATDFLYGEPLFVDKDGTPIRIRRAHRFSKFVLYGCCCYIASCASFWRRRVLDDGHWLDPSYKVIMDGEYYCRLAKAGYRFRFLPATIAAFTWHDANVSNVFADRRNEEWLQLRRRFVPLPSFLKSFDWRVYPLFAFFGRQWRRFLVVSRLVFHPKNGDDLFASMREITDMAELKKIELNLLKQVHEFCKERGIRHYLAGGTLLGAVRHKGFIPWDDDIDLVMPRPDYERFCLEFAAPNASVRTFKNSSGFFYPYAKVFDDRTLLVEDRNPGALSSVFLDVFPVDGVSEACPVRVLRMVAVCNAILSVRRTPPLWRRRAWKKQLGLWLCIPLRLIPRFVRNAFARRLLHRIDGVLSSRVFASSPFAGALVGVYGSKEILPREAFSVGVDMPFEDGIFSAMVGWNDYLSSLFGDYMTLPPPEKRITHHDFRAWWK